MRCISCHSNDWENVDQYRLVKKGMAICKSCGFVSYPEKYKTKDEIIEYYRKDYRPAPQAGNMFTGKRKLIYHHAFLMPMLHEWRKIGLTNPVVLDIGAAYGMALHWFSNVTDEQGERFFDKPELHGVEITQSYRRCAWHEYRIDLKEDFDDSLTYDFIMSYKVAEHMMDFDLELKRYHKCLSDNGRLYISVPTWFKRMHNFGVGGWDLEYYYHPDHINVWTQARFEKMLAEHGFKIITEDHSLYDDTYLCEKSDPYDYQGELESYDDIKTHLKNVKTANDLFLAGKYQDAIKVWPDFPTCHRHYYETNRAAFHKKGFDWINENYIKPALAVDETCPEYFAIAADLAMRYRRYADAVNYIERGLRLRPNCENFLQCLANCYRCIANETKDEDKKHQFLEVARNITRVILKMYPNSLANCLNWIYSDNSKIPIPSEK